MEEIWKDIEGYEGIYQVSNLGRVRSLDRIVPALCHKTGTIVDYHRKGCIIRQRPLNNGSGYLIVTLNDNERKAHTHLVHRLVARAIRQVLPNRGKRRPWNVRLERPLHALLPRRYAVPYGTLDLIE